MAQVREVPEGQFERPQRNRGRESVQRFANYGCMTLLAVFFLFPLAFMFASSFKPERLIFSDLQTVVYAFIPRGFTTQLRDGLCVGTVLALHVQLGFYHLDDGGVGAFCQQHDRLRARQASLAGQLAGVVSDRRAHYRTARGHRRTDARGRQRVALGRPHLGRGAEFSRCNAART